MKNVVVSLVMAISMVSTGMAQDSRSSSRSSSSSSNISISVSETNTTYKVKSSFSKKNTEKLIDFLKSELGAEGMRVNGSYVWADVAQGEKSFECTVGKGKWRVFMDRNLMGKSDYTDKKKIMERAAEIVGGRSRPKYEGALRDYEISKESAERSYERAQRRLEQAQMELERAQGALERAQKELETKKKGKQN
jgi:hypothetical protein